MKSSTGVADRSECVRILVVEDEPMIRMDLVDTLNHLGFHVCEAGSASEAMNMLEHGDIAALVTDLSLPDGNGNDLALRARSTRADLPVIFTTGYGDLNGKSQFRQDSRTAFLTKPFRPQDVADALTQMGVGKPESSSSLPP